MCIYCCRTEILPIDLTEQVISFECQSSGNSKDIKRIRFVLFLSTGLAAELVTDSLDVTMFVSLKTSSKIGCTQSSSIIRDLNNPYVPLLDIRVYHFMWHDIRASDIFSLTKCYSPY